MNISKILCPIDFSAPSDRALQEAVALGKRLGASVKAIHVFQRPVGVALEGAPVTVEAAERFLEQTHAQLRKHLDEVKQAWADKGVFLETALVEGTPAHAIVEAGETCDLIVMATHGRTGFQRFVLGSVSERVVRTATCPVLTIPMTEDEKKT